MTESKILSDKLIELNIAKEITDKSVVGAEGFALHFYNEIADNVKGEDSYLVTYIKKNQAIYFYNDEDEFEIQVDPDLFQDSIDFYLSLYKLKLINDFLQPIYEEQTPFKHRRRRNASNGGFNNFDHNKFSDRNRGSKNHKSPDKEDRLTIEVSKYEFDICEEVDTSSSGRYDDDFNMSSAFSNAKSVVKKSTPSKKVKKKKVSVSAAPVGLTAMQKAVQGAAGRVITPQPKQQRQPQQPQSFDQPKKYPKKEFSKEDKDIFYGLKRFLESAKEGDKLPETLTKYQSACDNLLKTGLAEHQKSDHKFMIRLVNNMIKLTR